jgi:heme oxygenase
MTAELLAVKPATLMEFLKAAIFERHLKMETIPFIVALRNGHLPLESYIAQIRAMAVIQSTLEHEFSLLDSTELKALMFDRPSRLAHLKKDLKILEQMLIPDATVITGHARTISGLIRRCRMEQPTDLLAYLYVLQGMTLGNAMHLPDLIKLLENKVFGTVHYYVGYGDDTARYWEEFSSAMNSFPLEQNDPPRLITVALAFFDQLEVLYTALYPLQNNATVFTASMLNPEAGDHAVPENLREIEAAVTAAQKCREEFPYFDRRYQERGISFAKSDAAWLVTLIDLPEQQLLGQVLWLGQVLASRGMPRITLERQLELLHEELIMVTPSRSNDYENLLTAAQHLKRERLKNIDETTCNDLAQSFDTVTGHEMQRTGLLILSAVCDEAAGVSAAVSSLLPWLTDPERFSEQWIAAVTETLEQARTNVRG